MVNCELLEKAEEKLGFAKYLMSSTNSESYGGGAVKHIASASKLAIQALTDLETDSPRAMQLALLKFEEPEAKQFARNFISAFRSEESAPVGNHAIKQSIREVEEFIAWVRAGK